MKAEVCPEPIYHARFDHCDELCSKKKCHQHFGEWNFSYILIETSRFIKREFIEASVHDVILMVDARCSRTGCNVSIGWAIAV